MEDSKEKILIQEVLAGNTQAFARLIDKYKNASVALAYNILLNQEDAEEIAQDAFIKAFSALHTFRSESRFSTWLNRIVINLALNKRKLKKYYLMEVTEAMENELPENIYTIDVKHINNEQRMQIRQALHALNENERLCITLYYLSELSVEEVHELTAISKANIKVLLHRGRKNMYASLSKQLKNEITNLL